MEQRRAFVTVADGTRLAARLWLPDALPAPVVLEALPYRMDDLTATYASEYERLCEEGGLAVCRLDIRGTGSSAGIATDEYSAQEHGDIGEVIAWLAKQEWSNGRVGHVRHLLVGLQQPAGRVRATARARRDRPHLRLGRPLHGRRALHGRGAEGRRPRRLGALHGRLQRPSARPGGVRRRVARGVGTPRRRHRAVAPALAGGAGRRALLAARLGAPRLRPDRLSDHARRRLGGRIHEHRLPRLRGAHVPEARCCSGRGATVDGHVAAGPAHRPRAGADPLVLGAGSPTSRTGSTRSRRSPCSRAARRAPRPISPRCAASGAREAAWPPERLTTLTLAPEGAGDDRDPRARRRRHGRVDLLRRAACRGGSPTISASTTRARSRTTGSRSSEELEILGHPRVRLALDVARAGRVPVRAALRRLPRRHVGPGRARRPQPHAPGRPRRPAATRARRAGPRWSSSWRRPRGCSSPVTGCGSRSQGRTGPTPGRRRRPGC